ncbi:MAG: cyclic nucleotide-binding domain-containing protein [Cyclobacteriaceae bacterium]|nr:cyclic nucleotide-binding domain-containing protein [Cyclobacteriaceae bacterium HetDA_MAG_MS6]
MEKLDQKVDVLDTLYPIAEHATFSRDEVIVEQFTKVNYFYLLVEGIITFYSLSESHHEEISVGESDLPQTPLGWSGFYLPYRYGTTIKAKSSTVLLLRWSYSDLKTYLQDRPELQVQFLQFVCDKARNLVREVIRQQGKYAVATNSQLSENLEKYHLSPKAKQKEIIKFLRRSPFFENFEEQPLLTLAKKSQRRHYMPGEVLFEQDQDSTGIFILIQGEVTFISHREGDDFVSFRSVSTPGFIVGWSGALGGACINSAVAKQETFIYFLELDTINEVVQQDSKFGVAFYTRLLWLINNHLQIVRSRLISLKYNEDLIAINNLVEQNSARLDISSSLHLIPHLLQNKLTQQQAFDLLHQLNQVGTGLEKHLASLALDLLDDTLKEFQFYRGLIDVYDKVTSAPEHLSAREVRVACSKKVIEAFDHTQYQVSGWENLPDSTGHIFIYNHLKNDPYNTLPNNFQITLDSHFISSVILFKKYGDPGIRIVRIGRGSEYAHQDYYQRLGHIDVFTAESDLGQAAQLSQEEIRKAFYEAAGKYLLEGTNLAISPEGTSYDTEESPGPFKAGAFNLALQLPTEPLIVPISVANFDKRSRHNVFKCEIHKPFYVSDYLSNTPNKEDMKRFLKNYQKSFKEFVQQTLAM